MWCDVMVNEAYAREQKIEGDNAKGVADIRATTPSVQTCRLPLQNM
jgi:hypothetical protein